MGPEEEPADLSRRNVRLGAVVLVGLVSDRLPRDQGPEKGFV